MKREKRGMEMEMKWEEMKNVNIKSMLKVNAFLIVTDNLLHTLHNITSAENKQTRHLQRSHLIHTHTHTRIQASDAEFYLMSLVILWISNGLYVWGRRKRNKIYEYKIKWYTAWLSIFAYENSISIKFMIILTFLFRLLLLDFFSVSFFFHIPCHICIYQSISHFIHFLLRPM